MDESELKFRKILPEDYESIRKILDEVEWPTYPFITDQFLFKKLLENTDRSIVALEKSRIVGVATAMCNDVSIGYVTMLAVSPDKQGCGLGSKLVTTLIGNDPNIRWVLSSRPERVAFWEKHGFVFTRIMAKLRAGQAIDKSRDKHTDLIIKKTFTKFIRKQISRIYHLNIYQIHKCISRLISKTKGKTPGSLTNLL